MHVNMMAVMAPTATVKQTLGAFLPSGFIMDKRSEERFYPASKFYNMILRETGYAHIQGTKPDTVGKYLYNSKFFMLSCKNVN